MATNWDEAFRRIAAGADAITVIDATLAAERVVSAEMLRREVGDAAADQFLAAMREVDSGISTARGIWHALSPAQRRTLRAAAERGSRLTRLGSGYRHAEMTCAHKPVRVATMRNLCARDLLAWEGGAFDPEAAAIVTERGRFVVAYGQALT